VRVGCVGCFGELFRCLVSSCWVIMVMGCMVGIVIIFLG